MMAGAVVLTIAGPRAADPPAAKPAVIAIDRDIVDGKRATLAARVDSLAADRRTELSDALVRVDALVADGKLVQANALLDELATRF
jgi:hypothetical protein